MKQDFTVRHGALDGVQAFLSVAQHRSFRRAAAELGVTPSAISQAVRALEARVGAALFMRTTRSVGLTQAGEEGQMVHGEVYEVEDALLPWLDTVEGSPGWFQREPIEVEGHSENVWAYFYQGDPADRPRVASGRWDNERAGGEGS